MERIKLFESQTWVSVKALQLPSYMTSNEERNLLWLQFLSWITFTCSPRCTVHPSTLFSITGSWPPVSMTTSSDLLAHWLPFEFGLWGTWQETERKWGPVFTLHLLSCEVPSGQLCHLIKGHSISQGILLDQSPCRVQCPLPLPPLVLWAWVWEQLCYDKSWETALSPVGSSPSGHIHKESLY